jgi:hypothetical protein
VRAADANPGNILWVEPPAARSVNPGTTPLLALLLALRVKTFVQHVVERKTTALHAFLVTGLPAIRALRVPLDLTLMGVHHANRAMLILIPMTKPPTAAPAAPGNGRPQEQPRVPTAVISA